MAHFGLSRLRNTIANFIDPKGAARNKFNEAFLASTGSGYTAYDDDGQVYIEKGYNINPLVYSP